MLVRDILSWWTRPRFLWPGARPSDTLFAGPWVGEFGWELMSWQGMVRKLAPRYKRVIISCRPESQALYQDFATDFVVHQARGAADCNALKNVQNPEELVAVQQQVPPEADWLRPLGHQPPDRQHFVRFGKSRSEFQTDILFHPRGRQFDDSRNYTRESWNELVAQLSAQGYRLACIGLSRATLDVEGDFVDRRDQPLQQTMDDMASTRLVIGPSSGPMHLASLCGTPHLVWADRRRFARGLRSRDKYEWAWNPLGTHAVVYDAEGFQPRVAKVAELVTQTLQSPAKAPRET